MLGFIVRPIRTYTRRRWFRRQLKVSRLLWEKAGLIVKIGNLEEEKRFARRDGGLHAREIAKKILESRVRIQFIDHEIEGL